MQDFHTYFAGDAGVWVHNTGEKCREFWRLINKLLDEAGAVTPSAADVARGRRPWLQAFVVADENRMAVARQSWIDRNPGIEPPSGPDLPWDDMTTDTRLEIILGHSDEIHIDAVTGIVAPSKVYSYNEWKGFFDNLAAKWNRTSLKVEINHGAPTAIVQKLQELLPNELRLQTIDFNNDVPSFPFMTKRHSRGRGMRAEGVYEPTFHDLWDGNNNRGVPALLVWDPEPSAGQIRAAIKSAHEEMHRRFGTTDNIDYSPWATSLTKPLLTEVFREQHLQV